MDGSRFDRLVLLVTEDTSRRGLVRAAGASALGAVGLASLLGAHEANAKGKGKKKKKRTCKAKPAGTPCEDSKICCTRKTGRTCGIPFGGSEGDPLKCCAKVGKPCEFPSDCCAGATCNGGPTCVVDPA